METITEPSQTIEGETFTIEELMKRAMNGMDITRRRPIYLDAEELEYIDRFYSPSALDLTDLEEFRAHVDRLQKAVDSAYQRKEEIAKTQPKINEEELDEEELEETE